jgi:hypothetical protein
MQIGFKVTERRKHTNNLLFSKPYDKTTTTCSDAWKISFALNCHVSQTKIFLSAGISIRSRQALQIESNGMDSEFNLLEFEYRIYVLIIFH